MELVVTWYFSYSILMHFLLVCFANIYISICWYRYNSDRIYLYLDLNLFLCLRIHPFQLIRERKYPKIRLWFQKFISFVYVVSVGCICWSSLVWLWQLAILSVTNVYTSAQLETHIHKKEKTQTFRGIFLSRVYKIRVYANHIEYKWTKNNGSYYRMR